MKITTALLVAIVTLVFLGGAAQADKLSFSVGSRHYCPEDTPCRFNEENPGMFYTFEDTGLYGLDITVGAYQNSMGAYSGTVLASDELITHGAFSAGWIAGVSYYPEVEQTVDSQGRKTPWSEESLVPLVGLQASYSYLTVQAFLGDGENVSATLTGLITFGID